MQSITFINLIFLPNIAQLEPHGIVHPAKSSYCTSFLSLQVSDSILSSLERLGVVLFSNFTRLAKGPKLLCCKALVHMLLNLAGKGPVIRRFLSELGELRR